MERYSCELSDPFESFVFEAEDYYDFLDYLDDYFPNETSCYAEFEYDPGTFCEISSDDVERRMMEFSRKYLDDALDKAEVLIEELDGSGKVVKTTTRLLADIIYNVIKENAKEEASFHPTRRHIQCEAVHVFAENSTWHCDFLLDDKLLDESDVAEVRAVTTVEKIKWMWGKYEVEPVIWFGQEFDYEKCCDDWMLTRDYSCWSAVDADYGEFDHRLADLDDYMFYYSRAEYYLEMPSIMPYVQLCPIKMDDTGKYDPRDIDSYFYGRKKINIKQSVL